jgi:hypothetical protein
MADLNQGASIDAERLIDAVRKLVKAKGRYHTEQNYKALADALDAYDATCRTPPTAAAGAEGLPPLPKPSEIETDAGGYNVTAYGYTAEQYQQGQREAIAADRAQRKQAALQEIIDIGQEIEVAPVDDPAIGTPAGMSNYAKGYAAGRKKERAIADDLRAQLAAKGQGVQIEPLKYGCGPHFEYIKGHNDALRAVYADAAPASAQPADLLHAARASLLDPANYGEEYGNHRSPELCAAKASADCASNPAAPMLALLRMVEKDLRNAEEDGCCYFESSRFVRHILNSAQPDQRESAVPVTNYGDAVDKLDQRESAAEGEAKAVLERAADMLEGYAKYCYRVKPDEIEEHPYIPSIEEVVEELRALAASPAAKPAKDEQSNADKFCDANCVWTNHAPGCFRAEGEQPTNNKGESA